jgi:Fe-S cluster assembly scaffold protein SufB
MVSDVVSQLRRLTAQTKRKKAAQAQAQAQTQKFLHLVGAIDSNCASVLVELQSAVDQYLSVVFRSTTTLKERLDNMLVIVSERSQHAIVHKFVVDMLDWWDQHQPGASNVSSMSSKAEAAPHAEAAQHVVRPHLDDLLHTIRVILTSLRSPITLVCACYRF